MGDIREAEYRRHKQCHLEPLDERFGTRAQTLLLEECLFFERLEIELLRESVDAYTTDRGLLKQSEKGETAACE
jgi:hypothetical protein